MKTAFLKDTIREIRGNFGRFLSLFLIVLLGCGFFSGIKATQPDMVDTAADYFEEYKLMDLKLTSDIGVRSSDVEAVKLADHVKGAHAAYSKDVFYPHNNQNIVVRCISFNSTLADDSPNLMNKLNVIEGRLPENDGECAIEVKLNIPETFKLGEKLHFTEPDDSKALTETLENDTFEVVGVVTSPMYIGFERDPTSEGDGTIVSNVFLREEEFITPYYTEMFVDIEGVDELDPFSDEYRKAVSENSKEAYQAFCSSVNKRYTDLKSQAEDRIASAKTTTETLNKYINMDLDQLLADLPKIEKTAAKARKIYEEQLDKGKRGYLEKSAMLKAEKALRIVQDLIGDNDDLTGEAHQKYISELDTANMEIHEAEKQLAQVGTPEIYQFDRFSASNDYASFKGDSNKIDLISRVFPVFFVLVASLVCLTNMSRLIEEQRGILGIYKALGYPIFAILGKYLVYSGLAALCGGLLGSAIGLKILPQMIYNGYKLLYNIPELDTPLRAGYLIGSAVISMICICGVTALTCLRELREVPGSLMRPKLPKEGRRVMLENNPKIWGKLSFMSKVTTRNMLRYKRRFTMTLAGVAGCTALIITGFGLKYSIGSVVDKQFNEVFVYDGITVLNNRFSYESHEEEIESINEIGVHMQTMLTEIDASADDMHCTANICVPDTPSRLEHFVQLRDADSLSKIALDNGGVVITEKLAALLEVSIGDEILLADTDGLSHAFSVSGICRNYAFHYIFMTPETFENGFGRSVSYNIAFLNLLENTDFEEFRYTLMKSEHFFGLTYKEDQSQGYMNSADSLNKLVAVLIFSAGLLAIVVLYNLAEININERKREIATIKVLGFFDRETDDYILRENIISALLGVLIGMPLGRILHYFVTVTAEVDILMFNRELAGTSLVYGCVITLFFTLAVNVALHFVLKKIDMAGSLKAVE
ncbi:ABC transporter permease [uncultured Ruminococcus sp.]|uniref:ABC transporter permease n=1 Tax=uncultured Ruminococcus sp. TaxID=165186 RepID=UPI0025EE666E|nr:ABC transporter permease [uncultured Ruminococcus sp.]